MTDDQVVDVRGLAEILGIRPRTVYSRLYRGSPMPLGWRSLDGRLWWERREVEKWLAARERVVNGATS